MRNLNFILFIVGLILVCLTGCEKQMTQSMIDSATTSEIPTKDDPAAYTMALVQAAVDLYKAEGIEAVSEVYNDPANIDGQWYVFITGENDIFLAHAPRPDFVGTDLKDLVGSDGYPVGVEIAKATDAGLWIEYLWPNPESGVDETKRTWAIRHNGYLFGSGYYQPAAEGY